MPSDSEPETSTLNKIAGIESSFLVSPAKLIDNLTKLSLFAIFKSIKSQVGLSLNISRFRGNSFLTKARTFVLKLTEILFLPVHTSHEPLNSCKGVSPH